MTLTKNVTDEIVLDVHMSIKTYNVPGKAKDGLCSKRYNFNQQACTLNDFHENVLSLALKIFFIRISLHSVVSM